MQKKAKGETVYVLMTTEGGKKGEWRPVAVVTDPGVAEQYYEQYQGKGVDWVPLGLDEYRDVGPEHKPTFIPRQMPPGEERAKTLRTQVESTIGQLKDVITQQQKTMAQQQKMIEKLQRGRTAAGDKTPPKPAGFAEVLEDAQEIADYIETWATYEVDNEFVRERFRGTHAVLRLVPIADLKEGGRDNNQRSKKNEDKYLKQDLKTQPPALVEGGKVLDGNHRLRANKRRGLTHMWCYVVMEGDHGEADSSGDQES